MDVSEYKNETPEFIPHEFFTGCLYGSGGYFSRWGNLKRKFYLSVRGEVKGKELLLHEDLLYDNGDNSQRLYTIVRTEEEKKYRVTSDAMVGEGSIEASGNALNWNYVLKQEVKGKVWHLKFDDWMFLLEDGSVLNRAQVSKFGFDVGHVILHFEKKSPAACDMSIKEYVEKKLKENSASS